MNKFFFICLFMCACHSEEAQYPDAEEYSDSQDTAEQTPSQSGDDEQEDNTPSNSSVPTEKEEDPCMDCEWFPASSPLGCDHCMDQ